MKKQEEQKQEKIVVKKVYSTKLYSSKKINDYNRKKEQIQECRFWYSEERFNSKLKKY